jgi:hypothetical protein
MKTYKPQALFALIIVIAVSLSISSCGGKKDTKTTDKNDTNKVAAVDTAGAITGDWVVIRDLSDPDKLNPIVSTTANAYEIEYYIFDMLLNQDRTTYELVPMLAEGLRKFP